jgi:hypothetical protein
MFSAGLNDLLFKRYVSKDHPKGVYIALIGVVWSNLHLILRHHSESMESKEYLISVTLPIFNALIIISAARPHWKLSP